MSQKSNLSKEIRSRIHQLDLDIAAAVKELAKSKTYHNAVVLQRFQQERDQVISDTRKSICQVIV